MSALSPKADIGRGEAILADMSIEVESQIALSWNAFGMRNDPETGIID
jgi:hypothetical protein